MQDVVFWRLISELAWKHAGRGEKVVASVVRALAAMPADEIVGFQNLLTEKLYALYGHDWARAPGDSIWWGEPSAPLAHENSAPSDTCWAPS